MVVAEHERASLTDSLPHERLATLCRDALNGHDPTDDYMHEIASLAWEAAFAVVSRDHPVSMGLEILDDGSLENASLSTTSDGTVGLSMRFLRQAAINSLIAAEESTLAFSIEFAFGAPPQWVIGVDDFVYSALNADDKSRGRDDTFMYHLDEIDHIALLYSTIARGDPAPPVGRARKGFRESGALRAPTQSGDFHLVMDPEWGEHILRLHHHLLINTLVLSLVHECAHVYLGHFARTEADILTAREHEVAADRAAYELLHSSGRADLPAALGMFKYLHDSDAHTIDEQSLTHPHSERRLRLLAVAIRETTVDPLVTGRMNETLRSLATQAGAVPFFDTRTGDATVVPVSTCSDWSAAYVIADVWDGEKLEHDSVVGLDISFVRPVDESVVATAHLVKLVPSLAVGSYDVGDRTLHRVEARIKTPPAWRFTWPDGMVRIDRVIPKDDLESNVASQVTRLLSSVDHAEWSMSEDQLMGPSTIHIEGSLWGEVSDLADWLDDYGRKENAIAFRALLIDECPDLISFRATLRTVRALNESGEHRRALHLGERHLYAGTASGPGLRLEMARAADALGDVLRVYEETFLEMNTFGQTSPNYDETMALFVANFQRHPDHDVLGGLLTSHQNYMNSSGRRVGRRRRRAFLLAALQPLIREPLVSEPMVSVGQLRAEIYHDLGRLGDQKYLEAARQHYDGITSDLPWFVGGWIQAAYVYDDFGDREAALHRFRIAEAIAPRHVQVEQARTRFFKDLAHQDRAGRFLRGVRALHGLDDDQTVS